jgi:hypothetical protein
MTWRDREGWLDFVFCDDGKVVDNKERDGEEDENDVEDTSGHEQSGVQLAWLGWADLVSVLLHAGSGFEPGVLVMVTCLAHEILWSPSFSWRFVPSSPLSRFLVLNCTIT